MPAAARTQAAALVLTGGHESDGGDLLAGLASPTAGPALGRGGAAPARGRTAAPAPGRAAATSAQRRPPAVATPGRALERALADAFARAPAGGPVVVVPMTLGRDPRLVSDTARTVAWMARGLPAGRLAVAPPFGTPDHLVGWLRAACGRLGDARTAALIAAPSADPFDDAELHRVVALVRAHAGGRLVEVGLRAPDGDLDAALDRCRRLGASRVAVVPAEFGRRSDVVEPLLGEAALARILQARVASACHRLAEHGDDGIAAALGADHEHGFAHSHAHEHGHTHAGGHVHAAGHAHDPHRHHDHHHDHAAVG